MRAVKTLLKAPALSPNGRKSWPIVENASPTTNLARFVIAENEFSQHTQPDDVGNVSQCAGETGKE